MHMRVLGTCNTAPRHSEYACTAPATSPRATSSSPRCLAERRFAKAPRDAAASMPRHSWWALPPVLEEVGLPCSAPTGRSPSGQRANVSGVVPAGHS